MMTANDYFHDRNVAATVLTLLPGAAWLAWLVCYLGTLLGLGLASLALLVQLPETDGTWFRWTRTYMVSALGAGLFALCHAINMVAASKGVVGAIAASAAATTGGLVFLIAATNLLDLVCLLGRRRFPVRDAILGQSEPVYWPGVCFQIPAYDEPPELVIQTIRQLLRQDYPGRWVIQVIDNNTPDTFTWHPVRDFCAAHRVEFMHLEKWPGFKAGALNEGIRRLPHWVEHVAIVDADYLVDPHFLRTVVPNLKDPLVAYVQTPQSYRGWQWSRLLTSLFYFYEEYYQARKPARREVNGIICVGTMAVIRRAAIEAVGLWDETSCTEDAEVSLRLLGRGWYGLFDHRVKGAGIMPLDFNSLRKQRFRWALGMMHIFRKHRRLLFAGRSNDYRVTLAQRLSFWGLSNQYFTELIPPICTATLLAGLGTLAIEGNVDRATPWLLLPSISLALYLWTTVARVLLATRGSTQWFPIVGALVVTLSLSWVTAWACICGLTSRKVMFLRTQKAVMQCGCRSALRTARTETALAIVCALSTFWSWTHGLILFGVVAGLLSVVFGSASVVAVAYAWQNAHLEKVDRQPAL